MMRFAVVFVLAMVCAQALATDTKLAERISQIRAYGQKMKLSNKIITDLMQLNAGLSNHLEKCNNKDPIEVCTKRCDKLFGHQNKQYHIYLNCLSCCSTNENSIFDGQVNVKGESNWVKVGNNVCFHPSGDRPAEFLLPRTGRISRVTLSRRSGTISCNKRDYSFWGCKSGDSNTNIVLSDYNRKVLSPVAGEHGVGKVDKRHYWVARENVKSNTKSFTIHLKDTPKLEAGVYQVWYGEDYAGYTEGDNRGKVCLDVFVKYFGEGSCPTYKGKTCAGNGACTPAGCVCDRNFAGDACEIRRGNTRNKPVLCWATGDPHYKSFDNARFNVYRPLINREFLMYSNPQKWNTDHEAVAAYLIPWRRSHITQVATDLIVRNNNDYVHLDVEHSKLWINCDRKTNWYNNAAIRWPHYKTFGKLRVSKRGGRFTIWSLGPSGLYVHADHGRSGNTHYINMYITIFEPELRRIQEVCSDKKKKCPYDLKGMRGLCGNFDGHAGNDMTPRNNVKEKKKCEKEFTCTKWNTPKLDVLKKVMIPKDREFRSCNAQNPKDFLSTSLLSDNASIAAKDGDAVDEDAPQENNNDPDSSVRQDMPKREGNLDALSGCPSDKDRKCAQQQCQKDMFEQNDDFKSLDDLWKADKNGKFSQLQAVTAVAYQNCLADQCDAPDSCKDVGDAILIDQFMDETDKSKRSIDQEQDN